MLHYSYIYARIISRQVPDEYCVKNYEPSTRCFGGFILYQSSLSSYILIGFFDPWPVAAEFESIASFLRPLSDLVSRFSMCVLAAVFSKTRWQIGIYLCVCMC